jgi:uroporphyrinogen decarboxylase
MTRRGRVIAAISHQETDIIPYNIDFTVQEYEKAAAYFKDRAFESRIGNHVKGVDYSGFRSDDRGRDGYFRDDFGVVWNRNGADKDIGVIEGLVIPEPDIDMISLPELPEADIRKMYENLVLNSGDVYRLGAVGFSMYERAWTLRGMENFLTDMILEPDFANHLLDAICEYNMKIIDIGLEYDIDGFHFGDDWGQQRGLIMGPELWRKFIKPRMARMYEHAKSKGKFISQHSCGDIHEIFPDLIDMGLDVYQTFQPEIYDIYKVKKEFGDCLSFWGGISTQALLPFATPQKVKEKTIEIMRVMGKNGGYIASPTHAVPGDVPPENIEVLIEVFQNQNKYI